MAHLPALLTRPEVRPAVVADATALVERQVRATGGVPGMALRSAHRVLASVRPGMVAAAVDGFLEPFARQLDPYYQEHLARGVPLADLLVAERAGMAEALLAITDERAGRSTNRTLRAAYQRVRGFARPSVEAAAPGIAALIAAHAPGPSEPTQRSGPSGDGEPDRTRGSGGPPAQPAAS
jgi:hypothetical protein